MAYKRAPNNSFAEFQMGEGFGNAASGAKTPRSARSLNSSQASEIARKVTGYEGYPDYYGGYDNLGDGNTPKNMISSIAQEAVEEDDKPLAGAEMLGGVTDDAFAGYVGLAQAKAQESDEDDDEDEEDAFDGYGGLSGTPLESFHTFFHKASMAKNVHQLTAMLAQAVKAVPADTPESVKQEYYRLATEMLKRRKQNDLHHMNTTEVEIQSNIGWLVNPNIPKTGGFDAVINKTVGAVGAALGKNDKDDQKRKAELAISAKGKAALDKAKGLAGYSGLGNIGDSVKYVGVGLAGLAVVGAVYMIVQKQKATAIAAKKNKKNKKKK